MQELSIDKSLVLKNKFKLKPYRSILAYGGIINLDGNHKESLSELYHIIRPNIMPGQARMNVIHNIKYFANKVSITSCEEALSFVRLLTAPMLDTSMKDYIGYEVLIKENFNTDYWLGADWKISNKDSGYCAVISKADAERIKIQPAVCTKGRTFKISRYIYQNDKKGLIDSEYFERANLFLLQEEVTASGLYRLVKKSLHRHDTNVVAWTFPVAY
ncbi:MAG: hypothetical protein QM758_06615 [Armatimonas sp.]